MDPYKSTYQNDYTAPNQNNVRGRAVGWVPTNCRPRYVPGLVTGIDYGKQNNLIQTCPCQAGGLMPQRGAVVSGLPTNLNRCPCFTPELYERKPKTIIYNQDEINEPDTVPSDIICPSNLYPAQEPEPVKRIDKVKIKEACALDKPKFEPLRPIQRGKYGGQRENQINLPLNSEEGGNVRTKPCPGKVAPGSKSEDRIPGPYWNRQKVDERKDSDAVKKRKYEGSPLKFQDEQKGQRRDETMDHRPPPKDDGKEDSGDDNQAQPYQFKRACKCSAPRAVGEVSTFDQRQDPQVPRDVEKAIRHIPEARLSCAPAAEPSKFDQPNTFMRKLYEKYPYLYKVLKETPPEELISKVFKDRFLSTYQIDYLHMGIGKEQYPAGGLEKEEIYTGPDGQPETKTIPGCSYRSSKKGEFGRKKTDYEKKEKEEEVLQVEKEEPKISEYMGTISKLGGEIVNDQLYKVAQITKNIRSKYASE
ncbi:hypothetical protein RUM44_006877 [Polyplax serrata]|uniref:Uncharacterized protein n=1 Tax=Polyplax serrata TaxID=468196 RepID=A0ABR1AJB2_POLSC